MYIYIYISPRTTREHEHRKLQVTKQPPLILLILLMEEILHQFIGSLPYYLQGFSTLPGGCLGFLPCQEYQYHRIFFGGEGRLVKKLSRLRAQVGPLAPVMLLICTQGCVPRVPAPEERGPRVDSGSVVRCLCSIGKKLKLIQSHSIHVWYIFTDMGLSKFTIKISQMWVNICKCIHGSF